MRHLIAFTKDQISIIETSLEASLKYADSEYISEVDNILEKIKNLDNKNHEQSSRLINNQQKVLNLHLHQTIQI